MKKVFKIHGDLNDPIVSNTILFVGTYIIVITYLIIVCKKNLASQDFTAIEEVQKMIVQGFADAIIPTTITFALGIVMQNIVTAIDTKNLQCSYTLLEMFFCIVYAGIYIEIRDAVWWASAILTFAGTGILIYMAMISILQLQSADNRRKQNIISG